MVTLLALVSISQTVAALPGKCSEIFAPAHSSLLETAASGPEALLHSIDGVPAPWWVYTKKRIFQRFWNRPEVETLALEILTVPANQMTSVHFDERLKVKVMVQRSRSSLTISIPVVKTFGAELGGRTSGLDVGFTKFMTGMLRAIEQEKISRPSLKHVRIDAQKIMNADLIVLLKQMGFQSAPGQSTLTDLEISFDFKK